MTRQSIRIRTCASIVAGALSLAAHAVAQAPLPPASGRVIETGDGDVVVLTPSARVTIVRRTQGPARLLLSADRSRLAMILEPTEGDSMSGPGSMEFRSWQLDDGTWPLGARWEGHLTLDEYMPFGRGGAGLALHTDQGMMFIGHPGSLSFSPAPIAIVRSISSRSRSGIRGTFDELERAWLAGGDDAIQLGPRAGLSTRTPGPSRAPRPRSDVQMGTAAATGVHRVRGESAAPKKVHDVPPVYPEQAKAAGIEGIVILEITVAADGTVSNARVLRSIPVLDAAALECARQWRYEPTLLNGAPIPVTMTAAVNFTLSR